MNSFYVSTRRHVPASDGIARHSSHFGSVRFLRTSSPRIYVKWTLFGIIEIMVSDSRENVYGAVIMIKSLAEFTQFI